MGVEELRGVYIFEGLNDEQLSELAAASTEVSFSDGQELWREAEPADSWWVLLEGRVELRRRMLHQEESTLGFIERPGDWAGGFRAWADSAGYLATGRSVGAGRVLQVPAAALRDLVNRWFPLGLHLINAFFQTVRNTEALSRQREALVALGQLAAGLAHELNNPASAATRSVDALQETCDDLLSSLVHLAEASMTAEQFIALNALRREIGPPMAITDTVALADREEELTAWLESRGVDVAWRIAPALAAAGVDIAWCERAAGRLPAALLAPGLHWVASAASTKSLLGEVKEATARISALVGAVRSYSQLDRASEQVIDVTEGLESTIVMFGHRLRDGVTVVREYGAGVPRIEANPAELNQVWTNLIDNAIDAMGGSGTLRVSTRAGDGGVVVEIADTGPGMPPEVRARAFEPFFTTKDVGRGTGLGLDISRRIVVERHHGSIEIDSAPGNTVMRVHLPERQAAAQPRDAASPAAPDTLAGVQD